MLSPIQKAMKEAREKIAANELKAKHQNGEVKAIEKTAENYSEFEVLCQAVEKDVIALAALPSTERDQMRKTLVDRYMGHVEAYLEIEGEYANPVLAHMVMWLLDLGRIGEGLELGVVAVKQNQQTPKQIKRDMATFVADEVLKWCQKEYDLGKSCAPYFECSFKLLDEWTVPDVVNMRYNKLAGKIANDDGQLEDAVKYLEAAIQFETPNHKAQVTTLLNKVRVNLAKQTAPALDTPKPD